ncbi:MAG: FitA-like ribbon-helix-helix domain-containing protein [Terracidiphilus sp.]
MAQLLIRKVTPEVMQWLEARAKSNGRSIEDEAYEIIRNTLDKEDEEAAAPATRSK